MLFLSFFFNLEFFLSNFKSGRGGIEFRCPRYLLFRAHSSPNKNLRSISNFLGPFVRLPAHAENTWCMYTRITVYGRIRVSFKVLQVGGEGGGVSA